MYKPVTISLGKHEYRQAIPIDVFTQFTILKKLTPILVLLEETAGDQKKTHALAIQAIAGLSDEDSKFLFDKTLITVERKESEKVWARIYTIEGGFQYNDIDLFDTLHLVAEVLKAIITPFFSKLNSTEKQE